MSDFSAQIATAQRMIMAKGVQVILTPAVGGVDAPFAEGQSLPVGVPTYMLSVNAGLARYYKFKPSKEEDRLDATLLLLMPGGGPVPGLRSSFMWPDGLLYYVKAFDVLAPNGTPILYFLEASH